MRIVAWVEASQLVLWPLPCFADSASDNPGSPASPASAPFTSFAAPELDTTLSVGVGPTPSTDGVRIWLE